MSLWFMEGIVKQKDIKELSALSPGAHSNNSVVHMRNQRNTKNGLNMIRG